MGIVIFLGIRFDRTQFMKIRQDDTIPTDLTLTLSKVTASEVLIGH